MRTYPFRAITMCGLLAIFSCKKMDQQVVADKVSISPATSIAAAVIKPLTVVTIAGKRNELGNADGPAKQATFNNVTDVKIADDGSLYLVDKGYGTIRKLTTDSVISTIKIASSNDGQTLKNPTALVLGKDGSMTILNDVYFGDKISHPLWMVSAGGQVTTPPYRVSSYWNCYYTAIAYDPYSNYLKACGARQVIQHSSLYTPFMENLEINDGIIGTNRYVPPVDTLRNDSLSTPFFRHMICGYNGVKYFVIGLHYIYKLTPGGVFTRIYRDLYFSYITSMAITKDSRTIYLADHGKIEAISNGKITTFVGPNIDIHKSDGVGRDANV